MESRRQTDICTLASTAASPTTAKSWKRPEHPLADRLWINGMEQTHDGYHPAFQRRRSDAMLRETGQRQRANTVSSHLHEDLKQRVRKQNGGWGRGGNGNLVFKGDRVSVLQDGKLW